MKLHKNSLTKRHVPGCMPKLAIRKQEMESTHTSTPKMFFDWTLEPLAHHLCYPVLQEQDFLHVFQQKLR